MFGALPREDINMPLPTLHLLVAQVAAEKAGISLSGRFLLGNLAPDAIHARPGADRVDKNRTHLRVPDWNSSIERSRQLMAEHVDDPFLVGCAMHILTDAYWLAGPWKKFRAMMPEEITEEEERTLYYRDTDALDRYLFRQNAVHQLWSAAMAAKATDYADLVTGAEVDAWRKDRYAALQQSRRIDNTRYITVGMMQDFVEEASKRLAFDYKRALEAAAKTEA